MSSSVLFVDLQTIFLRRHQSGKILPKDDMSGFFFSKNGKEYWVCDKQNYHGFKQFPMTKFCEFG